MRTARGRRRWYPNDTPLSYHPRMLTRHPEHLHQALAEVQQLLQRHRVLSTMARRQESAPVDRRDLLEILQERQNLAELERKLSGLHSPTSPTISPRS